MLVYLSTRGEARDVLDQRPLSDYTASGGLAVLWLILEEAFGESTAESFESSIVLGRIIWSCSAWVPGAAAWACNMLCWVRSTPF